MKWLKRVGWMALGAGLLLTAEIVALVSWIPTTHMWG